MEMGSLVMCKHFKKYGIVISEPFILHQGSRRGTSMKDLQKESWWVWVLWDNGSKAKWKTNYLEVVVENR